MFERLRGWFRGGTARGGLQAMGPPLVSPEEQDRIVATVATLFETCGPGLLHESQLPTSLDRVRQAFRQELADAKRRGDERLFEMTAGVYLMLADVSQQPPDAFARAFAAHERFMRGDGDTQALLDPDYMRERAHQNERVEALGADLQALQ